MAATDIQDVILVTLPNGETWLYKVLCNGSQVAIARVCACEDEPTDPGEVPDVPVDTDICRAANAFATFLTNMGNSFAANLTLQPSNPFGNWAVALTWLSEFFTPYSAWQWDIALALASEYNDDATLEDVLNTDGMDTFKEFLVCAAYGSIFSDPNGINLSPGFSDSFVQSLSDYVTPDMPNRQKQAAIFLAKLIPIVGLAKWKRIAFDTYGTTDETDLECDCDTSEPTTPCDGIRWNWSVISSVPAGFTVPSGDVETLVPDFKTFLVTELGDPETWVDGFTSDAAFVPNVGWVCPNVPGGSVTESFMCVVYTLPVACDLTEAHIRVRTHTLNSKRGGIYYLLDGDTDTGSNWHRYGVSWLPLHSGDPLFVHVTYLVAAVKKVMFVGAYGGGQLDMIDTSINMPIP